MPLGSGTVLGGQQPGHHSECGRDITVTNDQWSAEAKRAVAVGSHPMRETWRVGRLFLLR